MEAPNRPTDSRQTWKPISYSAWNATFNVSSAVVTLKLVTVPVTHTKPVVTWEWQHVRVTAA